MGEVFRIDEDLVPEEPCPCPDCGKGTLRRRWSHKHERPFYGCDRFPDCRGAMGCHPNGKMLGTPADADTRTERRRAHFWFDKLWDKKTPHTPFQSRGEAYAWLARQLGKKAVHIAEMNWKECQSVISIVRHFLDARPDLGDWEDDYPEFRWDRED